MTEIQASLENIGRLNRRLSVVVPVAQLEQTKENRLAELAKKTRIDGFRPGKVPVRVIEKLYGDSIWREVIQSSLETSLFVALEKNALNPAGQPHIDSIKAEPGNDLEYTATFEVYPQCVAPGLTGVNLERLHVDITEADVDSVVEKMRHRYPDWVEVLRQAQSDDQVTFDMFFPDGEVRKDVVLTLEAGLPEEFAVLFGSAMGDTLPVVLHPRDSKHPVSATLKVTKVAEPRPAVLDQHFAHRLGVEAGGMDALRVQIREPMRSELDRVLRGQLKAQAIDHLLAIPFDDLPQVLIDKELHRLEDDVKGKERRKGEGGTEQEGFALLSEEVKQDHLQEAVRRVKLGLLFRALIEKHQLKVDERRVQQAFDRFIGTLPFTQAVRDQFYKDKNVMRSIHFAALEEQVIDKLLEEADYTEKVMQYVEIMDSGTKQ